MLGSRVSSRGLSLSRDLVSIRPSVFVTPVIFFYCLNKSVFGEEGDWGGGGDLRSFPEP